jgi:hypothetical protein
MATHAHSTPARSVQRAPSHRKRRQTLEAALDRLLAAVEAAVADLDQLDGDADLEPALGSVRGDWAEGNHLRCSTGASDDLEDEHDGREPGEDDEHNLGRSENIDQTRFEMAQPDLEPSLGASAQMSQLGWGAATVGWHFDAEDQCDDEGAADCDREPDAPDACIHYGEDQREIVRQYT